MSGIINQVGARSGIISGGSSSASAGTVTLSGTTGLDYEEGTFTPAVWIDSTISGVTQDLQNGAYTKVGNLVTCIVGLSISDKGSGSGNVTLRGLPFTVANTLPTTSLDGGSAIFGYLGGLTGISGLGMLCQEDSEYLVGYQESSSDGMFDSTFTNSHITDTFNCRFSVQYFTDS